MHHLALSVDLPVFRQLPVEGVTQAFEHPRRGFLPAWRRDERLRHRKPRGPQDLCALAVADVDRDRLEVQRFSVWAAHEAGRHVDPNGVAIFARVATLDSSPFFTPRDHSEHRLLQRGHVLRVCDVEQRQLPQLFRLVTDQLAEGRVHGGDAPVKARKSHARLRLLEESSESRLALALSLFHAMPLADVVDQGQQPVLALGRQPPHRRFDLDATPVLSDKRRFVAEGGVASLQSIGELGAELLALLGRGELDQRAEGRELLRPITGQRLICGVAGHIPTLVGDHQPFSDVADRLEQRRLPLGLPRQAAIEHVLAEVGQH